MIAWLITRYLGPGRPHCIALTGHMGHIRIGFKHSASTRRALESRVRRPAPPTERAPGHH